MGESFFLSEAECCHLLVTERQCRTDSKSNQIDSLCADDFTIGH